MRFAHSSQIVNQVESTQDIKTPISLGRDVLYDFSEEISSTHVHTQGLVIYELIHVYGFLTLDDHIILFNHLKLLKETSKWYQFTFLAEDTYIVFDELVLTLTTNQDGTHDYPL